MAMLQNLRNSHVTMREQSENVQRVQKNNFETTIINNNLVDSIYISDPQKFYRNKQSNQHARQNAKLDSR